MVKSALLSPLNIHPTWHPFLTDDITTLLSEIEDRINIAGRAITPDHNLILRFLEMDLSQIKIVILGQDPYPQQGVATGRAFEVKGLNSWADKFRNVSLKNMVRAIYKAYNGTALKYSQILPHINQGDRLVMDNDFQILPPNKLFEYWWTKQNVLLLNTAFTCEIGKPNSHTRIWAPFTRAVLEYIAMENKDLIWFLWGNNAQQVVDGISISHKIETSHPMICYQRENDILFGKCNPFEATKDIIDWTGYASCVDK